MYKLLLLGLAASVAIAADMPPMLFGRQITTSILPCSYQGQKDCGVGCIDLTWTCCPSQAGGCPPTKYCNLAANNEYNCCPIGEICGGPGGAITNGGTTISQTISKTASFTSTSISTPTLTVTTPSIPGPTSTGTSSHTASSVTSTTASIVAPSRIPSSNSSVTTTARATFTGAASEHYGATSPAHALGAVLAALFMLL